MDFGFEYFPITEGAFSEYEVLEVFHDVDVSPQHDSSRYILKTKIGEEVLDNSGRLVNKFFQYRYDISTGELLDQRVWTLVRDGGRGEVVEENQRLIKMVFAVKNDQEWDVNAFNSLPSQEVFLSNVGESRSIEGFPFEETAIVNYDDFFSLVDYRKKREVYAKGVGLVERSFKDFTIQNFDTTDIRKGTEVHYRLINYGVE
ncbi:hypothetical protein DIT68_14335 [Brumimicrobium oceani]|uniref:DUF3857 domain-containing protein n=1 Tax=Brumimicrobium oceani TaxID=2100725 RepID=A0A2U2X243_9FLAO|nr:hypothetical protein DIT68_14335 [Brumimicrobium oceani]